MRSDSDNRGKGFSMGRLIGGLVILAAVAAPLWNYYYHPGKTQHWLEFFCIYAPLAGLCGLAYLRLRGAQPGPGFGRVLRRLALEGFFMAACSVLVLMGILVAAGQYAPNRLMDPGTGLLLVLFSGPALGGPACLLLLRKRRPGESLRIALFPGMFLGALISFLAWLSVGYAVVYALNSQDGELTPEAQTLLADPAPCEVPDAENGYYAYLGLQAESGLDPHQEGLDIVAANRERGESERMRHILPAEKLSDRLTLAMAGDNPGLDEAFEDNFLEYADRNRDRVTAYAEENRELLDRYINLFSRPRVCVPPGAEGLIPKYGDVASLSRLYLALAAIKALNGDIGGAARDIARHNAFWAGTLSCRMLLIRIAGAVQLGFAQDACLDMLNARPELAQNAAFLAAARETFASRDKAAEDLIALYQDETRAIYRFLDAGLMTGELVSDAEISGLRRLVFNLVSPLYRPKETANAMAAHARELRESAAPILQRWRDVPQERYGSAFNRYNVPGLHSFINPHGRHYAVFNSLQTGVVKTFVDKLVVKPMLCTLRLEMILEGVSEENAQAWLDARPERDRSNNKAVRYDAKAGMLIAADVRVPITFPAEAAE